MKIARLHIVGCFVAMSVVTLAPNASGGKFPEGFSVLPSSVSPDGRYAVLVPDCEHYKVGLPQNKLVDTNTGRVIAVIEAETGMENMNHGGAVAAWSTDGSLLHWMVKGKWFPRAKVLLKMNEGTALWQTNVLKEAQREILARARKAKPINYAAAVKTNKGNSPAYPDGFTVNVESAQDARTPVLPFAVVVTLTANPKESGTQNLRRLLMPMATSRWKNSP
jgi:hypothetical protein